MRMLLIGPLCHSLYIINIHVHSRSAEIIIHLSNEGADAFKPDLFGNQIVIERKLCRDGGNSYRIKSSTGKHHRYYLPFIFFGDH